MQVELSAAEVAALEAAVPAEQVLGFRYPSMHMTYQGSGTHDPSRTEHVLRGNE